MAKGSKGVEFRIVLFFLVLVLGYLGYQKYGIPLQTIGTKQSNIYDTQAENDAYIKANLSKKQLSTLDRLLLQEKKDGGLRLSTKTLAKMTNGDVELEQAYLRWRKCREMMRSNHHTIYPDERHLYKK